MLPSVSDPPPCRAELRLLNAGAEPLASVMPPVSLKNWAHTGNVMVSAPSSGHSTHARHASRTRPWSDSSYRMGCSTLEFTRPGRKDDEELCAALFTRVSARREMEFPSRYTVANVG